MAEASRPALTGYGGGGFRISGQFVPGSILINRERFLPWPVSAIGEASPESLEPILDGVELLLVGGGRTLVQVPPPLRAALKARGVAVEPMDTGAAGRTFVALLGEGRLVAAALVAIA